MDHLPEESPARQVLADSAYDADRLHDLIYDQGGEPLIPPRRHRKYKHRYDLVAYKQRWVIEGFFAKLDNGVASQLTINSPQPPRFIKLASIMLWLK